jgi:DNA-binding GntR family transcriptional regulator
LPDNTLNNNKTPDRKIAHEEIYKKLFHSIITGGFEPGKVLTIRGLAEYLGCSPMPIREAVRRLVALGALEMKGTRRLSVASMTKARLQEIWSARVLLEPEISARALANVDKTLIKTLKIIDDALSLAIEKGDADEYCRKNWEFHFAIYEASQCPILLRLVESIWLQFGPFMRMVTGRLGTSYKVDHHQKAIEALMNNDEEGIRNAIRSDIQDGMERILIDFKNN